MQVFDYMIKDGDMLKLYPHRPCLWRHTMVCGTLFFMFLFFPIWVFVMNGSILNSFLNGSILSAFLPACCCFVIPFGLFAYSFVRELRHKQPILVLTQTGITVRQIRSSRSKTLNWSEVDSVQLIKQGRSEWVAIYPKSIPKKQSFWEKMDHTDVLGKRYYPVHACLPFKPEELYSFVNNFPRP